MKKGSIMIEAAIVIPILFLVFLLLFRWETTELATTVAAVEKLEIREFRGTSLALSQYGLQWFSEQF